MAKNPSTNVVTLIVKVVPGSSRDRIVGKYGDALKVQVSAAPERGRANEAVIALIAIALLAGCGSPTAATVTRFEARLELQPDGSVQAHERLQVRTDAAVVRYRKPLDRMDAILDAAAGVDHTGRPGGASDSAPEVATEDGLTVDWPVPAGPDAVHTLVVTYHATGAVAVRGANATLWWRILPADRAFDVEHAVARLSLPPGTLLAHAPWTPEPGWTITREGNLLTAEARNIAADQPATLVVPFSVDPRAIVEPRWQFNLERGLELVPAFIAGGLFILVTGIGALVMIRLQ